MSVEAITWALRQPVTQSSAKFVLIVLANCASGDTLLAYPSTAYLVAATGQDRKTVARNLAKLREWGLITDTDKRAGATKQIVVYRVMCDADLFGKEAQKRNSTENGTVPKTPSNRPVFTHEQAQKRATEPSLTVSKQDQQQGLAPQTLRPLASPPLPEWLPVAAWAAWHAFRNSRKGWTAHARQLSLRTLTSLRDAEQDPTAVIEQSIEHGWTGLHPVRSHSHGASHANPAKLSAAERTRAHAIAGERADAERDAAAGNGRPYLVGSHG